MHWQVGGNLEPVQMICEVDWRECPKAIANYVWSEIVTDVLDCLRNESVVWRVLAGFLVCILVFRILCSKIKHRGDKTTDHDVLNKVGYKMEDLELKVNILTYKLQYGCWPLPHQVQKSNFRENLRNLRLTLSNPNDRNNWIKHVLLSPRRNESFASHSKYCPSDYRVTELYDAKKRGPVHPYLRREHLPMEHSTSKSSSDKSCFRLSPIFKNFNQKLHGSSRKQNCETQYRNAISLPLFAKRRCNKSRRKSCQSWRGIKNEKMTTGCRKFTRTMEECKRYLKQLHDSNKNLGLVCSSSDTSDENSIRNLLLDPQQEKSAGEKTRDSLNDGIKGNEMIENEGQENVGRSKNSEETDKQQNKNQSLELSSAIYPVLKLIDKRLLPSNVNIKFCSDMFPQRSNSNVLIPKSCERKKLMETSQETLYQVKQKLESLHNVLRMYELQSTRRTAAENRRENDNKISNVCQNSVDILVPVTNEAGPWNKDRRSKVNFNDTTSREMQRTTSNSSEQYESDETSISSMVSALNYSNTFLNDLSRSFEENTEFRMSVSHGHDLELIQSNRVVQVTSVKYEKIPERVYYAISSDSSDARDVNKETNISPRLYVERSQTKSLSLSDQYPVPMETDDDVIVSPTSSRTEMSKESEFEDKPTALLLREALQFKQALLTRVELENVYYIDNKMDGTSNSPMSDRDKYSLANNNLQTKFLDIISEEQSVCSSTEKTSRTYMFFNLKQEKQYNGNLLSFTQKSEIGEGEELNAQKEYLDSKQTLASPSEYFSFSNIIQEEVGDQVSFQKQNSPRGYESAEMIPGSLQLKYLNDALDKSDENLAVGSNANERDPRYDYVPQKQSFEEHFSRMNSINEFIYRSINSVELFSQNLDESVLEDNLESSSRRDASNFVSPESIEQYSNAQHTKNTDDTLNSQINRVDDKKYVEDHEISPGNPNLALKRNPGACSLIEQTLNTNIEERLETQETTEDETVVYDLSPCESKETSLEMNVIQASVTSSMNNSNDSNVPEPPSETVLNRKSLDEEKLNINWSNVNNNFSDDCIDENDEKVFSTNAIALPKYNKTNTADYSKEAELTYSRNCKLWEEENNSGAKHSCGNLDNEERVDEVEYYKSYCNLISPRSSMYFTDEASSSAAKLNNVCATNVERYTHSKLYVQQDEEDKIGKKNENFREIGNTETPCTSTSNECKAINDAPTESTTRNLINEFHSKQHSAESYNNKNNRKEASFEDKNLLTRNETNCSKDMQEISNNNTGLHNATHACNLLSEECVSSNRAWPNLQISKADKSNMEQCIIWSNMSPRQYSPSNVRGNEATRRTNTTIKSRSHENYTPRTERLRRQNNQNLTGLKSDTLSAVQTIRKSKTNAIRIKSRDLSAESRRNKVSNAILDKKRSKSQVSFRTNESLRQTERHSLEFPNSTNSVNYTQSLEMKSKLRNQLKALSPTPNTFSRSCIPILKSRLEAARKTENDPRPKSPMRGPLTMTVFCRDDLCEKNGNLVEDIQVEGRSKSNELCMENQDSMKILQQNLDKPSSNNITSQEQMIIYVNIFTKYDHNATKIVDPNKFLEYIKNRNIDIQNVQRSQANRKDAVLDDISADNGNNSMRNIVTVVSSIINGNELNQTTSTNVSTLKTQDDSLGNILLNGKLKNLCFLSVEQKEIDVTAKPSVIDTSTSISDLQNISEQSKSLLNKFQICGTPKELNNEEYIALLEILHQEPNFVHLQELQNVCTKLVLEHENSI